ncbi:MAG TPA: response regulator transcription factor [Burkholderiales bacterium]
MQTATAASPIHLVLVEDDVYFQEALRLAVRDAADIRLTGVFNTRAAALDALDGPPADVLLVDLGLPDGSGIDVIRAAQSRWPGCAVMVSTTFGDEAHVLQSIEAGATGYLLKDSSAPRIADEIRSLHGGGSPISPLIARQVLLRFRGQERAGAEAPKAAADTAVATEGAARGAVLSERERQVLELITKGFSYEEIARLMDISRHTVRTFVRRIYAKLEVGSKAEAIYEARSQGLLSI